MKKVLLITLIIVLLIPNLVLATDNGTKIKAVLNLTELIKMAVEKFKDIVNHWAKETIAKLINNGILNGYPDGTFRPDNPVTVAEFTKLALSTAGVEKKEVDGLWYQGWIDKAKEIGVLNEELYKRPNEPIKRVDMAVILARLIEKVPDLKNEFIQVKIEVSNEKLLKESKMGGLWGNIFDPYINSDHKQLKKVIITYGDGDKKIIYNWNKGNSELRLKDEYVYDKTYKKYYKVFPLDYTRFKYIVKDLDSLTEEQQNSICKLFDYGLLMGFIDEYKNVYYKPYNTLTRAEASTIVSRLLYKEDREVLDEVYVKHELTPYEELEKQLANGGIIRSNGYKAVLLLKDVLKHRKPRYRDDGTLIEDVVGSYYHPTATYSTEYNLSFSSPLVVFDNYLYQVVGYSDLNDYLIDKAVLYYIPNKYRNQFDKDIIKCLKIRSTGQSINMMGIRKSYGKVKVNFRDAYMNGLHIYIYPFDEGFKFRIDEEIESILNDIENGNTEDIERTIKDKNIIPYIKEIYKAVYLDNITDVDEVLKRIEPFWELNN